MGGDIAVRKAVPADAEKITDYNMRLARETECKELDRALVLRGVRAVMDDPCKGFYLVAEKRDGKDGVIGQLMVTFEWSDWRNKRFWWIQSAYVDGKFRNQKIFTGLYKEVLRLARLAGDVCGLKLYVEERNESAKKVYEILGMNRANHEIYEMLL